VFPACTPLFSAEKRILVYGRLTRIVPIGPALDLSTPHGRERLVATKN